MGSIPQFLYYPNGIGFRGVTGSTTPSSFAAVSLTADTHKAAYVLQATKAGAIHKVHFVITTITTDCNLDVRIETVDSTGNPTGTLWATTTNGQSASGHIINTWYTVTLTADATVAVGDKFAVVIQRDGAGTISLGIGNGYEGNNLFQSGHFPRRANYNGTSWTKDDVAPNVGIEMSDGTFMAHGGVFHTGSMASLAVTFKVGDAVNEEGNRFVAPFSGRAVGMFCRLKQGSAAEGQFTFSLYDGSLSAPASALASVSSDDTSHLNNNYGTHIFFFATPVWIKEGFTYRACVYSSAATFGVSIERYRVSANAHLICSPGGVDCYRTGRALAGPGTFSDTDTDQYFCLGLVIDKVGGLKVHPGMVGGVAA